MPDTSFNDGHPPITSPSEKDYGPLALFTIPDELKQRLFKESLAFYERNEPYGRQHMENMTDKNPAIASDFATKATIILETTFRLILPADTILDEIENLDFIAVSYCCHSTEWDPAEADLLTGWPFGRNLVHKVLSLRPSHRTGIWIDYICIDPINEHERMMTIACMDCIYRDARMVVYLMEDMFISQDEVAAIDKVEDLIKKQVLHTPPQIALNDAEIDVLATVQTRLFSRRFFDRAWCFHEFTVPDVVAGPWSKSQASYKFIGYETNRGHAIFDDPDDNDLYSRPYVFSIQAVVWSTFYLYHARGLDAVFADPSSIQHTWLHNNYKALLYNQFNAGSQRTGQVESLLKVFLHVILLGSSVVDDLVPITLNSLNIPVRSNTSLRDKSDFLWLSFFLALLSGDPCSLASMGYNIRLNIQGRLRRTWLYISSAYDPPATEKLFGLEGIGIVTPECIELDMVQFCGRFRTPEPWALEIAGKFLQRYLLESSRRRGSPLGEDSNFQRQKNADETAEAFNNMTMWISCIVERGLDWASAMWRTYLDAFNEADKFRKDIVPLILANADEQLWTLAHEHLFNLVSEEELSSYKETVLALLTMLLEYRSMSSHVVLGTLQFLSGNTIGILSSKRVGEIVAILNMFDPEDFNSGKLVLAMPTPLDSIRFQHLDRVWVLRPVSDEEWDPDTFGVVEHPDDCCAKLDHETTCEKANRLWRERRVKPDWRLVDKVQLFCPRLTGASFPDNDSILFKKKQLIVG